MTFDPTKPSRSQTYGDAIDSARNNDADLQAQHTAHMADTVAHGLGGLLATQGDYNTHKANVTDAHGLAIIIAALNAAQAEVTAARGSQTSLTNRVDQGLLPSGAVRLSSLASKWITPGDVPTYVDSTHFTVPTDRRLVFIAGAMLRLTVSGAYVYAPVASSAFGAGVTTVTLDPGYPVLTAGLSALDLALIAFDNNLANSVATTNANLTTLTNLVNTLMVEQIEDWVLGKPGAGAVIKRFVAVRNFTIPIAQAGSQVKANVAATATAVFNLAKNGVNFGTWSFAAAGTVPTLAAAAATSFVAGDVLSITAPGAQDATLADIALNLKGTLT